MSYTKEDYNTGKYNLLASERKLIILALNFVKGGRDNQAKALGISRRTLFIKMGRHDIKPKNKNIGE